jgi:hypothetical protein
MRQEADRMPQLTRETVDHWEWLIGARMAALV